MIHAALDYVQGSNRILEKLVSGEWDEQFLVAEPGHLIRHGDFSEWKRMFQPRDLAFWKVLYYFYVKWKDAEKLVWH